ncbi:unnamed protein product [Hyaloperonospora brassicae]|uniref:Endoplasmic reticulum transmembrane protein n=1 Tax=Hyaloperonospora brassicae TaxID=162125 RepID=A0AAV0TGD4_HYABA|nr:unnamed protein product [Hyaloperonospora brassicae]
MLLNTALFYMMLTEAAICLVLSLPVGQWLSHAAVSFLMRAIGRRDSLANTVATVVLALVSLLFLSDVSTVYKHHSSDEVLGDGLRVRLLTAQRDVYITGFCLFLFLLLRLVYIALATNLRLEKSLEAMTKQAEGAASGYTSLLEDNERLTKQTHKLHALLDDGSGSDDAKGSKVDVLARLVQENADLEEQAEGQGAAFMTLLEEKQMLDKQLETAASQRSQLERQREEIATLTAERDALKSQIHDYDFMFPEAKKKAE